MALSIDEFNRVSIPDEVVVANIVPQFTNLSKPAN
jgi:hypothetical protein